MTALLERETCRSPKCGMPIYRLPNDTTGQLGPVDVDPAPNGNVVLIEGADGRWRYHVLTKADFQGDLLTGGRPLADAPRHLNHWITCADREWFAEQRRKKGGRS